MVEQKDLRMLMKDEAVDGLRNVTTVFSFARPLCGSKLYPRRNKPAYWKALAPPDSQSLAFELPELKKLSHVF